MKCNLNGSAWPEKLLSPSEKFSHKRVQSNVIKAKYRKNRGKSFRERAAYKRGKASRKIKVEARKQRKTKFSGGENSSQNKAFPPAS